MLQKIPRYLHQLRSLQRLGFAMARAGATAPLRQIDPAVPTSWEFSGFSQHGEDGIIDYLTRCLRESQTYFIELGCGNGLENNSSWLALARSYSGLMVDGNAAELAWCEYLLRPLNYGLTFKQSFVTRENIKDLLALARCTDPDLFSLDIDGNDYHVADAVLKGGLRPRILVVEYNAAFGPNRAVTIPYRADFRIRQEHGKDLYCGCSVMGWRKLTTKFGYRFVTVDLSGTNAFFVDPQWFDSAFLSNLRGLAFRDNSSHLRQYRTRWEGQFDLIKGMELVEIT
jgi:hypothetical protein